MSRVQKRSSAVLGGPPRVDLLPQEIRDNQLGARQRGWMTVGVIAALGLAVAGFFAASTVADGADQRLADEQDRTAELLAQQAEFAEVRAVTTMVESLGLAQQSAGLTEIAWTPFIIEIQDTLPGEVRIVEFSITSSTAIGAVAQSADPLIGARVATIDFTAESPDLPNVRQWLDALTAVQGFTDATPGAVSLNETTQLYEASITMGVDEQAWSDRFVPEGSETDEDDSTDEDESDEDGS